MPTIFDNQTFTIPAEGWPADGVICQSAVLPAQNVSKARFVIQCLDLDPDEDAEPGEPGGFTLEFVVEESLDGGATWAEIGQSFDEIKGTKKALAHIIELDPKINVNPGSVVQGGGNPPRARVSHTQVELSQGADYRFRVYRNLEPGSLDPDLQSITLTVNYSFT